MSAFSFYTPEETAAIEEKSAGGIVFDTEAIVEAAFQHFRKTGFPYRNLPLHVSMQEINQLANTPLEDLFHTHLGYQVADTYHPHRFHASAIGMNNPFDAFNSDKLLRRVLNLDIKYGGKIMESCLHHLMTVSGTQGCSNFRPGFASLMYRTYCKKGDTVLDTSTGYGGRIVGFIAARIAGTYIGIDPNTKTFEGNTRMAAELGYADRVRLIHSPAEDVDVDFAGIREVCDFGFTSPPYFRKEIYSAEDTQSCNRYTTGDAWRAGFLLPMLRLQFAALKPGAFSAVNIAPVKVKGETYPLDKWTRECAAEVGFQFVKLDQFRLAARFGAGMAEEVAFEPVIILQKPA
jgi:hypothetical protein